ncbi:MAG: hypothetical protein GC152_03625 [Alphaproteobacteria bacterium]|nr:hypothetical protein [Alphaproteobacteria bacterium]
MSATHLERTISTSPLTLRELCQVNEILVPLASSDRPLEAGIEAYVPRTGGRVQQALRGLHTQLVRGVPLDDAVASTGGLFSTSYQQIVQAGLTCGRLAGVLQLFSEHVLRLIDLRQQINRSLVYPVIVALTSYLLFLGTLNLVFVRVESFYADFRMPLPWALAVIHQLRITSLYWFWIPPLVFVSIILWWSRFNDGRFLRTSSSPLWRYVPGLRPVLENFKRATFARLLAVMMDQQIPYDQALRLTAQAMGDDALLDLFVRADSTHIAGDADRLKGELSPYLAWIVTHGSQSASTSQTLKGAADLYQQRANRRLLWFQLVMPMILLALVGGITVFLYALTVFIPMAESYESLNRLM